MFRNLFGAVMLSGMAISAEAAVVDVVITGFVGTVI